MQHHVQLIWSSSPGVQLEPQRGQGADPSCWVAPAQLFFLAPSCHLTGLLLPAELLQGGKKKKPGTSFTPKRDPPLVHISSLFPTMYLEIFTALHGSQGYFEALFLWSTVSMEHITLPGKILTCNIALALPKWSSCTVSQSASQSNKLNYPQSLWPQ